MNLNDSEIKIGLGKGRGFVECLDVFDLCDSQSKQDFVGDLLPVFYDNQKRVTCVKARQGDLVWMLKNRHIDVAVGSSVWFVEHRDRELKKTAELDIKPCRLSLIVSKSKKSNSIRRICTRFPEITASFFHTKGKDVEIIPMQGCHEIALALEFADAIVDVIETGQTIRRMGLYELEPILQMQHQIWVRKTDERIEKQLSKSLLKTN